MRGACLLAISFSSGCLLEPDPDFVDPREGLLIEWSFAPPASTSVADRSGNAYDLALQGAHIDGDAPAHAVFDGDDDIGIGPDLSAVLPAIEAITLEARVRITDASSDFTSRPILFVPQTSDSGNYGIGLVVNTAARRLQFELVAGDEHQFTFRDQLYEAQWVTVHGVYDGVQAVLYVDGAAPLDPIEVHGGLDGNDFEFGEQIVTVAGRGDGGDNLGCALQSIRVWTRALSPAEITDRHDQLR
jgi:Concanavalin A-like lectin/glucanases superfamily